MSGLSALAEKAREVSPRDFLPFVGVTAAVAVSALLLLAGATKPGIIVCALALVGLSAQLMLVAHRATRRFHSLADAVRERGDESLGSTEIERIEFLQRRILAAFESERLETAERFKQLRDDDLNPRRCRLTDPAAPRRAPSTATSNTAC